MTGLTAAEVATVREVRSHIVTGHKLTPLLVEDLLAIVDRLTGNVPPGYTWTVITALPDMTDPEECTGNLATALGSLYVPTADQRDEMNPTRWEQSPAGLGCRVPVFALGEILLCAGGREITGHGRKPSKWGVEYETFTDLTAAMARAAEVTP